MKETIRNQKARGEMKERSRMEGEKGGMSNDGKVDVKDGKLFQRLLHL